jgi:ZIP family zinc transporter
MLEAAAWGLLGASSLLVGALIGIERRAVPTPALGLILGFGAGTLLSAVAFELTEEAYTLGGADAVALGLAGGGLAYFAGDQAIRRRGGKDRMSPHKRLKRRQDGPSQGDDSGAALLLGAVLDGIPESVVIGISLLGGQGVSVAVLAAVFLSNLPEAIGSSAGMRKEGNSRRHILLIWLVVVLASGAAAALGFGLLNGASGNTVALIEAFAGGAVLTMLVDVMIPQARTEGGPQVGLVTVLGFALAYLLSTLE